MPISDMVATVTQIHCFRDGRQQGVGTGFFYLYEDNLHLITNRHVIINEEEDYIPDEIRLRLHTDPNDIRQNDNYSVRLYNDDEERLWHQHPTGHNEIDVAVIPMNREQVMPRFFIKAFRPEDHVPQNVDISIGEDVLVIGYPLGFHDALHNLPIIRNAIISSVYPVPFQGYPIILIDSRLHSGTSGSPVFTKPSQMIRYTNGSTSLSSGTRSFLVGVHSGTFDIVERDPDQDEPLGLNAVWFASLIPEIITQAGS